MNAIIYTITSPDGSEVYVGSSTQLYLSNRKAHHRSDYKRHNLGQAGRCKSYDLFDRHGFENCRWEVIEILNESTKEQKLLRERHWIEAIGTLGQNRPVINEEEKKQLKHESYKRLYAEKPEVFKAQSKAYYEATQEERKEVHQCECGGQWTGVHKNRHLLSRQHRLFTGELQPEEKKEKPEPREEELAEKRRKNCEATKRWYAKDPERHRQRVREYVEKIGPEERARRYKEWYDKVKTIDVSCACGITYKKGNTSAHLRTKHHIDYINTL
jgi:hypothetical protein